VVRADGDAAAARGSLRGKGYGPLPHRTPCATAPLRRALFAFLMAADPGYRAASSGSGSSFAIAWALTFMEQNLGPHMEQNAAVL
jgi:hypothetical protein